jgi:hypothetical protein
MRMSDDRYEISGALGATSVAVYAYYTGSSWRFS